MVDFGDDVGDLINPLAVWASGTYCREAVVEMLARIERARFLRPSYPWIIQDEESPRRWINAAEITDETIGALSGGEQKMLRLSASLLGGAPVDLEEDITGLDANRAAIAVAALAHATGYRNTPTWYVAGDGQPPQHRATDALVPWPDPN